MVNLTRKLMSIILSLILTIFIFNPITVSAEKSLVFDDAILFTEEEITKLETEANGLSNTYHMDIVIVTTKDTDGKTSREYADDFFDYESFGVGDNHDGILFLIDMDNREVFDNVVSGDYYEAANGFLKGTNDYLESGIPSSQYNKSEYIKPKNKLTFTDIIISLVGGILTSSIFYFTIKSVYKTPRNGNSFAYKENSFVNLTSNEDKLIDTFVTHRIIPKPTDNSNSSSGRSTTHTSSSGNTHGGGGRKF